MIKAIAAVAAAFVVLLGGMAVSGESFTGYDEHGNLVHVVDGRIVSTTPRDSSTQYSAPPVVVQPRVQRSYAPRSSPVLRGGIGHGPTGRLEYNPYDPRKWWRNEAGMIDQINRDYPPVYPRHR